MLTSGKCQHVYLYLNVSSNTDVNLDSIKIKAAQIN